jgi:hypothetical protein
MVLLSRRNRPMLGTIISFFTETRVGHTMKANAVALSPPAISRTTPRSQVINDTIHQGFLRHEGVALGHTSHGGENDRGSNDDMSSLREWSILEEVLFNHFSTNVVFQWDYMSAVYGKYGQRDVLVVDIFAPKHSRAILTIRSSGAKLFRMFPYSSASFLSYGYRAGLTSVLLVNTT